jgi:DNA-binding Lrp family transcriptional regulator
MAASRVQASEIAQGIGDLIAALNYERRVTEPEARRLGYYSAADAAKAMGISTSTVQRKLKVSTEAGILERVAVTLDIGGMGYFYRAKNKS